MGGINQGAKRVAECSVWVSGSHGAVKSEGHIVISVPSNVSPEQTLLLGVHRSVGAWERDEKSEPEIASCSNVAIGGLLWGESLNDVLRMRENVYQPRAEAPEELTFSHVSNRGVLSGIKSGAVVADFNRFASGETLEEFTHLLTVETLHETRLGLFDSSPKHPLYGSVDRVSYAGRNHDVPGSTVVYPKSS